MCIKLIIIFSFILILQTSAKFLFPEHAQIFSRSLGLEKSYFGFSVQLYSSADNNASVIVGSPKSSDINYPNLDKPGAIFRCILDTNKCIQYNFDKGKDNTFLQGKNNSYLGYSLDIDPSSGKLLACAPRWNNYYIKDYLFPKIHGMCYTSDSNSNYVNISSFGDISLQYHLFSYNYIFGEGGFASALLNDNIIYTALGLRNWTGSIIQYDKNLDPFIVTPKNVHTLETYSYFGYSLTYGHFNTSDLNKIFYVTGAPRSENLTGRVYVYEQLTDFQTFPIRYEFPGRKFGEYFGGSIVVADINGDATADIIIGAPMHNSEDKEDIGCIYPYVTLKSDLKIKFKKGKPVTGTKSGERFGTALSSLGDINKDGCDDIAVGAPYYDGIGAVYIYLGQTDNSLKLDQIIVASEVYPHLRGFGFSLSRGTDIDNNNNNDLAIGAYLSEHVVIVKSKPIVDIKVTLQASINEIRLNTTSFALVNCVHYTAKQDVPNDMNLKIQITSDKPKISFGNKNEKSYTNITNYKNNVLECENIIVNIEENLSSDVRFNLKYEIDQGSKNEFCSLCPIENKIPQPIALTVHFMNGCGSAVCTPILQLSTDIKQEKIIIGSITELIVNIDNTGQNAFGVTLYMQFTPVEVYIESNEKTCTVSKDKIICEFSKPLLANNKWQLIFHIKTENVPFHNKLFNISSVVSSKGEGEHNIDSKILEKPLHIDLKYNAIPKSEPEQILISSNISEQNIMHVFTIENSGITKLDVLDIYLFIPIEYNNEEIVKNIKISGCSLQNEEIYNAKYETGNTELENIINLNCLATQTENIKCRKMKCEFKDENDYQKIEIRYDMNITMFLNQERSIYLSTSLTSDSEYLNLESEAITKLIAVPKTGSITLYIVIGIIVGILLILIIILILYKLGFFKRNRPPRVEEKSLVEENEDAAEKVSNLEDEV